MLAIILSIVPILSIFSSGSYESGILLSKSKESSANLACYIFLRSSLILSVFLMFFIFFGDNLATILDEPSLSGWFISIPFISLALIIVNISNEWFVKYKYFSRLSLNKALYTITNVISKVTVGFLALVKTGGLILGDIIGKVIMIFYVSFLLRKLDGTSFRSISRQNIIESKRDIPDFPKYMMPDQVLSNLGASLHIYFISAYFGVTEVGYIAIVSSLLYVPITVFASAIKDVFRQRAIDDYTATGSCRELYIRLLKPVSFFGIIGFSILYFFIPPFFGIFLGDQWVNAGKYAQILTPLFCLTFISMSLKDVFIVVKKMHIALLWQIFFLLNLSASLYFSALLFNDVEVTLYFMTGSYVFSHMLYILLSYIYSKS